MGRAVHELMAMVVQKYSKLPYEKVLGRYPGIDDDEVLRLLANGKWMWGEMSAWLEDAQAEVQLDAPYRGTADVLAWCGEVLVVIDWKTGRRSDKDHTPQLLAYAASAIACSPRKPVAVQVVVGWLQDRVYVVNNVSLEEIEGFRERVTELSREAGKRYSPGEHCQYCPRQLECVAKDRWQQASSAALLPLSDEDSEERRELSPERIVELYPRVQMLSKALDEYNRALRQVLEERGQVLIPGEDKMLRLSPASRGRVNAHQSLKVLSRYGLDAEKVLSQMNLSMAEVKRLVKLHNPDDLGANGRAIEELEEEALIERYEYTQVRRVNV